MNRRQAIPEGLAQGDRTRPSIAATVVAAACLAAAFRPSLAAADDGPRPPFRHCYYLFVTAAETADAGGAYVPLLVTREPLDAADRLEAAILVTYERAALWKLADSPVRLEEGAVDAAERKVRFEGRLYRYQEVPAAEAIRLLERPEGGVPLHRREAPVGPKGRALRADLLRDLSADDRRP